MSDPAALIIPTGGDGPTMVTQGYADALRYLGWKVIVRQAQWKQEVRKIILEHGIRLIFTCCKYGLSQLPITTINDRNIGVVIRSLMFNRDNQSLGGTTECVDASDPDIVSSIASRVVFTDASPWAARHFNRWWEDLYQPVLLIPNAGNILRACPESMTTYHDVSMVMNLAHRQDVVSSFIDPMFHRLRGRFRFNCHGDSIWSRVGVATSPLHDGHKYVATHYGQSVICPNLHTSPQREHRLSLNERTYTIAMSGGNQVCDNPLVTAEFDGLVDCEPTPSGFIQAVERHLVCSRDRFKNTLDLVKLTADRHTYFHRLRKLFEAFGMEDAVELTDRAIARVKDRHVEEMRLRIDYAMQGVVGSPGCVQYRGVN
jgi:hypothetical protein